MPCMSFLRNRTVIGVFCILLSVLICFGLTPLFNRAVSPEGRNRPGHPADTRW